MALCALHFCQNRDIVVVARSVLGDEATLSQKTLRVLETLRVYLNRGYSTGNPISICPSTTRTG